MTEKERRWKNCMDWFNANPNVKNYFIKAFIRVDQVNPFYEMEQGCKRGMLYKTMSDMINFRLVGIERYFLLEMRKEMMDYCRSRE